jgi:hypothetical protein
MSLVFIDSGTCGVDAGAPAGAFIAPTLSSPKEHPEKPTPEIAEIADVSITSGNQSLREITASIIGG